MLRSALFTAAVLTGAAVFPGSASADLQGSCVNVHREGPFLVASCRNAYGGYNTSRIELGSCPPGAVGNNNGQLTCYAGGGGYGGGYGGGGYGGGYGYGRPRYGY